MRQAILLLFLITVSLTQTQLRGSSLKMAQNREIVNEDYNETMEFMQLSSALFDTPPMDYDAFSDDMEIAREMGSPGIMWMMEQQFEATPSGSNL